MTITYSPIQMIVIELYKIFQEQEKLNTDYKSETDQLNSKIEKIQENCPWHTKHNGNKPCEICGYIAPTSFDRT